jgi:competence protein ComEC
MYTFGTISVYSLLANVLVLPLVPLIMCCTFLIIIIAPLSDVIGMMLGYVDSLLIGSIVFVAKTIEKLPFSSIQVSYSFTAMCLSYLMLIGVFMTLHARARSVSTKNETIETKNGEIISGIISY